MNTLSITVAELVAGPAWRDFLAETAALQKAGRTSADGDAFWIVVELAKAPLFEGLIEEDGAQMEEEVLAALYARDMITLDEFNP